MAVNEWRLNKTYFVYMIVLLTLLNEKKPQEIKDKHQSVFIKPVKIPVMVVHGQCIDRACSLFIPGVSIYTR